MSPETTNLEALNASELLSLIRRNTGVVVRRSVPIWRLVQLAAGQDRPRAEEVSATNETRAALQVFIEKNWDWLNSQLPCTGENRGRCTIYLCPEGRHLDCYSAAMKKKV